MVAPVVQQTQTPPNSAMDFIFMHESTDRLDAINSIGCIGLGQSCAARKGGVPPLATACPDWRTNRDCQISFWNDYAQRRYGGWNGALAFWQSHRWW